MVESELSISDDLMNTRFKDKLERSYKVSCLVSAYFIVPS